MKTQTQSCIFKSQYANHISSWRQDCSQVGYYLFHLARHTWKGRIMGFLVFKLSEMQTVLNRLWAIYTSVKLYATVCSSRLWWYTLTVRIQIYSQRFKRSNWFRSDFLCLPVSKRLLEALTKYFHWFPCYSQPQNGYFRDKRQHCSGNVAAPLLGEARLGYSTICRRRASGKAREVIALCVFLL